MGMVGISVPWVLLFGTQISSPRITVDEAVDLALKNAFSIRAQATRVEFAKQRLAEVKANMGPRVTLDGTYTRFDKASTATFGSQTIVTSPIDSQIAKVTVSMPIDISRHFSRGVSAGKFNLKASEELLNAQKNEVKSLVRRSFYQLLQADALVKVAEEAVAANQERLKNVKLEQAAGSKAKIDVLRFETQLAQSQTELISAKNSATIARNALNNVLGRPIETPVEAVPETEIPSPNLVENTLAKTAQDTRSELKQLGYTAEALKYVRELEERGLNPSLNASVQHQRNLGDLGLGGRDTSTTGVVALSIPVFDSGITRARVKAARQDEEQIKITIEQTKLGISLDVRQAFSNLNNARARLEVAEQQVALAKEAYRLAVLKYEAGEGIQLEVTDAQTELTRAQTGWVNSRYDFLKAIAELQRAIGTDALPQNQPKEGATR